MAAVIDHCGRFFFVPDEIGGGAKLASNYKRYSREESVDGGCGTLLLRGGRVGEIGPLVSHGRSGYV
jgi:hypothetical protein